jgi:hypothetical protein
MIGLADTCSLCWFSALACGIPQPVEFSSILHVNTCVTYDVTSFPTFILRNVCEHAWVFIRYPVTQQIR